MNKRFRKNYFLYVAGALTVVLILGGCEQHQHNIEETQHVTNTEQFEFPILTGFQSEERSLSSRIVGRDYKLTVLLPERYDLSKERYPILYLLDGSLITGMAANLTFLMNGIENAPEMIIVCISQKAKNLEDFFLLRELDYKIPEVQDTPKESHADLFLAAFKQEIIPFVEDKYRIDPSARIIWGYSSSGFFVLYALCHEPGLFRTYLAGSGDTDLSSLYVPTHDQMLVSRKDEPIDLYLSVGSLEDNRTQSTLSSFNSLVSDFKDKKYPGIRLITEVYEGETHGAGGIALTFVRGLRKTFPIVK